MQVLREVSHVYIEAIYDSTFWRPGLSRPSAKPPAAFVALGVLLGSNSHRTTNK
ncbi:MAG: hypothetical protein IIT82_05225 [Selenomonas sp.]|nr:hypothetical protein [Selenomonas sp.]